MPDAAAGAALAVVTDHLPGGATAESAAVGVTGLVDDPITGAVAGLGATRDLTWIGRSVPHPRPDSRYRLQEVEVDAAEADSYDEGHARQTIWPLYHDLVRPAVHDGGWRQAYRRVNRLFATAVAATAAPGATVWVHDYHLQLVPARLRQVRPDLRIGLFLHTGFPPADLFLHLPTRREIVTGLLGADLVGFQTASAAENFLRLTQDLLGMAAYTEACGGDTTAKVGVFPTSVDASLVVSRATRADIAERANALRTDLGSPASVVLSIDPGEESSGIERRLRAISGLLESGRVVPEDTVFVQIVLEPSGGTGAAGGRNADLRDRIGREVARINGRFASVGRPCVHYLVASPELDERVALYLAADVMVATPLREGASLPALEYVAARRHDGALILSEFTGTAAALPEAAVVNPYDEEMVQQRLLEAMGHGRGPSAMSAMSAMYRRVRGYDNHAWAETFVSALESAPARPDQRRAAHAARPAPTPAMRRMVGEGWRAVAHRG